MGRLTSMLLVTLLAAAASAPRGVRSSEERLPPVYRQGVAHVRLGWVFSAEDGLFRTDDDFRVRARRQPAIPAAWRARGFDHLGDLDVADGVLYAALEQPRYERGEQAVARFDPESLRFLGAFTVAQHENSFVAVNPATRVAYAMDRFDGDRLVRYRVERPDRWRAMPPLVMTRVVRRVQGADVAFGAVWLSADDGQHGLYRVELASGRVDRLGSTGHAGGEVEGIDTTLLPSGVVHVLTVDARRAPVWFAHFRVKGLSGARGRSAVPLALGLAAAAVALAVISVAVSRSRGGRLRPTRSAAPRP